MSVKNIIPNSLDQIQVEGLEVSCHVGVTEEERLLPQDLSLSIFLELPLQKAGLSDKLKDTVNYAKVMDEIRNLLQGKTFWLIEAVAEQTADLILSQFEVSKAKISVSKRTLPGVKSVTVSITRQQSTPK